MSADYFASFVAIYFCVIAFDEALYCIVFVVWLWLLLTEYEYMNKSACVSRTVNTEIYIYVMLVFAYIAFCLWKSFYGCCLLPIACLLRADYNCVYIVWYSHIACAAATRAATIRTLRYGHIYTKQNVCCYVV